LTTLLRKKDRVQFILSYITVLYILVHDTAVKRVTKRTHKRFSTPLTVIPVELDNLDNVGDLCRTFSVACAPDNVELSCTLNNYLNHVGVHRSTWELDKAHRKIVVTVSSFEGTCSACCGTDMLSRC